jgi:iron complex outermembrane receptor protein
VAIDDIERIEVTRGPNSAAYGPNSMMAIVNIITKHPGDVPKAAGTFERAGGGAYRQHVRVAGVFGSTALHVAASREGSDGYDVIDGVRPGHDSTSTKRLLLRSNTKLSGQHSIGFEAAYVDGKSQDPFKSEYDIGFPDRKLRDYYLAGTWNASFSTQHELQVRLTHTDNRIVQRWTACYPTMAYLPQLATLWRANPRYVAAIVAGQFPSGGTATDNLLALQAITAIQALGPQALAPLCGTANQNVSEKRTDLELQDTFVFSPALRLVSGAGARTQSAESQTYLGGKVSNNLYRLFANAEYKPASWINLNLGAYFEHDKFVGWETAPRAAANFHVTPNQSVRIVVSKGIRTPDVQEQRGNFSYTLERSQPFPAGTTSQFFQTASVGADRKLSHFSG